MIPISWIVTRACHFGACLVLLCVCIFDRLVAKGAESWLPIARRLVLIALPLALLSGIAWFALNAIDMSGLDPGQALQPEILKIVWSQTLFGTVWKWRLICWIGVGAMAAPLWFSRRPPWLMMLFSAALVGSLAWAGHGQMGPLPGWHLLADVLHLLVAALWPTGLLPLLWLLRKLRASSANDREDRVFALTLRFSAMSLASVAVLAATGVANALFLIRPASHLFTTDYGRVLILKISLFSVTVVLGAVNLLYLKPRLAPNQLKETAAGRLRLTVTAELVLATAVLIVVGFLGRMPPD